MLGMVFCSCIQLLRTFFPKRPKSGQYPPIHPPPHPPLQCHKGDRAGGVNLRPPLALGDFCRPPVALGDFCRPPVALGDFCRPPVALGDLAFGVFCKPPVALGFSRTPRGFLWTGVVDFGGPPVAFGVFFRPSGALRFFLWTPVA